MRTLFKGLIVIAIVVAGAAVMLTLTVVYLARNTRVHESNAGDKKDVQIETPFGNLGIHGNKGLDPGSVGIPVYPGAHRLSDSGGADFQFDTAETHKDLSVSAASYYSPESPEKIRDYYRRELPAWKTHWENDDVRLEMKSGGELRTIVIKREGDGTRIGVASIGPPASN